MYLYTNLSNQCMLTLISIKLINTIGGAAFIICLNANLIPSLAAVLQDGNLCSENMISDKTIPDDIDVVYLGNADKPTIPAKDYDKKKLIEHIHSLKWNAIDEIAEGPENAAPEWRIVAYQKRKIIFNVNVYGPKGSLFIIPEKKVYSSTEYWQLFRKELLQNKNEYGGRIEAKMD